MNFKPAKTIQRKTKADFEHMADNAKVKKSHKGPDGGVITEPRNFLTCPPKKGEIGKGTSFGGNLEHMPDNYERRKELQRLERVEHEKKVQDKPFSQKVKPKETFTTVKEVFGEDRVYPQRKVHEKRKPLMLHDQPFKPSNPPKKGYNGCLDKFPPYKEDPMKAVTRKKTPENEKPNWKPSH